MTEQQIRILDLDYAERQLIIVRDDREITRTRNEVARTDQSQNGWLVHVARFALPAFVGVATATLIATAIELHRASGRRSAIRVLPIRPAEARELDLPLGHPLFDVVYVGHPARPTTYFPLADFHRRAFEHKFTEALKLLSSLGAHSVKVSAIQGWGREFSTNLSFRGGDVQSLDTAAGARDKHGREFLYTAKLAGHDSPQVPNGLSWYRHEDTWQELARQRIQHGLEDFDLRLTYTDDYSINAAVAASAQKLGLKIGGTFEQQKATVWSITGSFPPRAAVVP